MLERLQLKNFQNQKLRRIKFDPHVTTIVGPSDSGKSSIIRALRWVIFNGIRSDRFIRHGETEAEVRIAVDGRSVTRRRAAGGDNTYHLDEQEYRAFGNGVPEPIEQLFNMNAVNTQQQHDPIFWFSDTPGQVSRNLNEIVDLKIIDATLYRLNVTLKTAIRAKDAADGTLAIVQEEVNHLAYVPSLITDYKAVKSDEATYQGLRERHSSLARIHAKAHDGFLTLRALAKVTKSGEAVVGAARRTEVADARVYTIRTLIADAKKKEEQIATPIPDIASLEAARPNTPMDRREAIQELISTAEYRKSQIYRNIQELEKYEDQLAKIKVCETCNRPL